MAIIRFLLLIGSILYSFRLLNYEISAHMFTAVLLDSLIHVFFGSHLDKAESSGSSGSAVGHQLDVGHFAELAEKFLDILLSSVIAQASHFDLEFLAILESWLVV